MKGKHTKKTSAFVKACLAYCHITIPSLDDIFVRLRLLLQCGEVALVNGMTGQGEGFLKASIALIPDVPATIEVFQVLQPTENALTDFVLNFTSFLLLFPGHPQHGPFYLVQGLLNAIASYQPWKTASTSKARCYLGVLGLFATYYQNTFPYHVAGVESNDSMYGGDSSYRGQINSFLNNLIKSILALLTDIGEKGDLIHKKEQGTLALDFANTLVSYFQMNPQSATLVVKLVQLAKKTDAVDAHYLANTGRHISDKKGTWYQDITAKLV